MQIKIDRSDWTPTTLGEVVAERRKSTKDPVADGLQHIVGLEHIDAESIHLRRSEPMGADTTFTKTFKKGDILFGRRRAYLKKAAQAPFAGICSGDITVMYAKHDLLPELLPFLINNDNFFDYAVTHSAGGLSPRVKFRDLANYPFLLPPKAEQERLAELLWAGDAVLEGLEETLGKIQDYSQSWLNSTINKRCSWPKLKLQKLANVQTGRAKNSKKSIPSEQAVSVPYLRVANVQDGYLDLSEVKELTINRTELERYGVQYGDVLMNEGGDHDKLGRGTVWRGEIDTCIHQNHVFVVRTSDQLLPEYLSLVGRSNYGKSFFLSRAKRTSNLASINSTQLKNLPVPLPEIHEQKIICERGGLLEDHERDIVSQVDFSKSLQKCLINQIF